MVNPGHPSRGCANCRSRRIKCDESRPRCRKCVTSRRTCLGYRNQEQGANPRNRGPMQPVGPGSLHQNSELQHPMLVDTGPAAAVCTGQTYSYRLHGRMCVNGACSALVTPSCDEPVSDTEWQHPAEWILDAVATAFSCLWDPAQSRDTRRVLLQRYQNATKLLRVSLIKQPLDPSLAVPMCAFALYEVRRDIVYSSHAAF